MWNDTDIPLAYLISFRCYGTWLHGDERGSTDRFHNVYKTPHIPPDEEWKRHNSQALKSDALTLCGEQRQSVENAIRETVYVSSLAAACDQRENQSRTRCGFDWSDQTRTCAQCI